MNAPEPVSVVPEQDEHTDALSQPREERMIAHRPAQARRERRFEIGFFIRKVVNGWLAYYKQFPPQRRPVGSLELPQEEAGRQASSTGGSHPVAMASSRRGTADDGVQPLDGPGPGGGDPGPIGSTRVEVGFFVGTTTETTGDEKS